MTASDERRERSREAFFGRVKGPKLGPRRQTLMNETLPRLRLDPAGPAPADPADLFAAPVTGLHLEIGFGGGEHLLSQVERFPQTGFIGIEPYINGMAKVVSAFEDRPLDNLRLFDDDAVLILDWLPSACLDGIDLLYPDPWPKRRHFKRRFVGPRNLDRMARVLKPGGVFRFASDIESYVNWTLLHCGAHASFDWTAGRADDWRLPFQGWPGTRYEAKALREGRTPTYLSFRRL